jgi:four helix bundle protein
LLAFYRSIARGSLAEVESQLILAVELGFLTEEGMTPLLETIAELRRMMIGLMSKIRSQ